MTGRALPPTYEVAEGSEPGFTMTYGHRGEALADARVLSTKMPTGQLVRVARVRREIVAVFESGRQIA